MSQPTPYSPTTSFAQDEANNVAGRSTLRTVAVDTEFDNIALTLGQILANLALIQRDDGGLRDGIVETWNLSADTLSLIGSAGFEVRGNWVTATAYVVGDMVREGTGTYVCVVAHTSGVFATDYAALKWTVLFDTATLSAAGISFSPTGTIAATNVQAAIAEAASEAAQKSANLSDLANTATARTNMVVFSKAEVQSLAGSFAVGGGTVDAITADFTPDYASWSAVTMVVVECAGANTSSAPTLNVDGLGAKTICDPSGALLSVGAIPGANFRALFAYDASADKVLLLNPYGSPAASAGSVGAAAFAAAALDGAVGMINGTIVASRSGNAETIAIKTKAGADPSAADPVIFVFRNVTAATGDYVYLPATAALSITISSGSTMGATNSIIFRLWLGVFNDGGTLRLGVVNCRSGNNIMSLGDDQLLSATSEGGAGGADSAQVIYANAAVTAKAFRILGYLEYTLAAVGTWGTAPSKIQIFGPGVPKPGDIVKSEIATDGAVATGTTVSVNDDTIMQNTEGNQTMTQAIVIAGAPNMIEAQHIGTYAWSAGATNMWIAGLFRDTTADAWATQMGSVAGANNVEAAVVIGPARTFAGAAGSTTIKVRVGIPFAATQTFNGSAGARLQGGSLASTLKVTEIMG